MKWYSLETNDRSLRDSLRRELRMAGIRYELSACGEGWHFEVLADKDQVKAVNRFLMTC